jgi:hypothetical protein
LDGGDADSLNSGIGHRCEGERGGVHGARGDNARLLQMAEGTHPCTSGVAQQEAG